MNQTVLITGGTSGIGLELANPSRSESSGGTLPGLFRTFL